MKSILTLAATVLLSAISALAAPPVISPSGKSVTSGRLETARIYSPEMADSIDIDIWTPDGYPSAGRYPVVYMHDGQNLFDAATTWNRQAWEIDSVAGPLMADGLIRPAIIVGIYSKDATRVGDLMPDKPVAAISNDSISGILARFCPGGVKGGKYVEFIAKTLKPFIDAAYPTLPEPETTFVMGSSMGGLASIYAMCEHPETFGGAACLSTHWSGLTYRNDIFPAAMRGYLTASLPRDNRHKLYMDCGDRTIDEVYIPYFFEMNALADSLGYDNARLLTPFFPGHRHSEDSWASRVAVPLRFLLPPERQ